MSRALPLIVLMMLLVLAGSARAQETANYPDRIALIANTCPYLSLSDFTFMNRYRTEPHFSQRMRWKNIGRQPLIAFEIVILKYDAFNRRISGMAWTVTGRNIADWRPLEPGAASDDGIRSPRPEEVFTAIAYVRAARLKNGTVWYADENVVRDKLRLVASHIEDFGDIRPDPPVECPCAHHGAAPHVPDNTTDPLP